MIFGNFGALGTSFLSAFACKTYDKWRLEYAELRLEARGWSAKYNFNKWLACKRYESCGRDGEEAREEGGTAKEGGGDNEGESAEESGSAEEGGSDNEGESAEESGSAEEGGSA